MILLEDDGHNSKVTFTHRGREVSLTIRASNLDLSQDQRLAALSHLVTLSHELTSEVAVKEGWEDAATTVHEDAWITDHTFKPGRFSPDVCQVQLARYPCGRPRAAHVHTEGMSDG